MKRKLLLVSWLLIFFCLNAVAQFGPPVKWKKTFGTALGSEDATSVVKTTDGHLLIAGQAIANDGDVGFTRNHDLWLVKVDQQGQVLWKKTYSGAGNEVTPQIENTPDGGYILACAASYNGPDTLIPNHYLDDDIFVMKLDRNGNIQWKKNYGGNSHENISKIIVAPAGGYIMLGHTVSRDHDVSGLHGISAHDIWVVKIDDAGAIQWQRCYGGTGSEQANYFSSIHNYGGIAATSDGGYIFTGSTNSNNGDVIGYHVNTSNSPDAWVVKINSTGGIEWSRCYGGSLEDKGYDIKQLPDGNFLLAAYASSNDGDIIQNSTTKNAWIAKLNPTGTILWQTLAGRADLDDIVIVDNDIYLSGGTSSSLIPGYHPTLRDGLLVKMDLNGNIKWMYCYGGTDVDDLTDLAYLGNGEFVCAGYSRSNDGDVGLNRGFDDYWVIKLGATNTIEGTVFIDNNSNGIKDSGEPLYKGAAVTTTKGTKSLTLLTAANGHFGHTADTGSYVTSISPSKPYYTISPSSKTSVFTTYGNTDSFGFALAPIANINDLRVSLIALTPLRPGFYLEYRLAYFNEGTTTLNGVSIKFIKTNQANFISSIPTPQSVVADTIVWNIGTLAPSSSGFISITMGAKTPLLGLNIGDTMNLMAVISPTTGDHTVNDNYDTLRHTAQGAYDPNDKVESHGGSIDLKQLQSGKSLQYTVRFQNTGNDTAFTVVIRDTLENKLDLSSIEMIAASHPYTLTIADGNKLEWTFNNILLPDSNRNEPLSHGFVAYRVKPKSNLVVGDIISNSASIYFDFNLPVKTNTHQTVIKLPAVVVVQQPAVSGIVSDYCSTLGVQKGKLNNLPAAGSGITVTVKLDGNALAVAADSTFSINVSGMAAGNHVIEVTYSNSSGTKTTTANFAVDNPVTPAVNVTVNRATVYHPTDEVLVTATNAVGGGNAPVYTFARNRAFTDILQAEGIANTYFFSAASLQWGENKIYVRMKTSSTCYLQQTDIDSIIVIRANFIGLVDPDFPLQPISLTPNPFRSLLVMSGFNTGKSYTVSVFNDKGRLMRKARVTGQQLLRMNMPGLASGTYMVQVYDETQKRFLGTAKVIKQ